MVEVIVSESIHERERFLKAWQRAGIRPVTDFGSDTQVVFNASVMRWREAEQAWRKRRLPLVNYVWDLYGWAYEGRRRDNYEWKGYTKFVGDLSDEIWVPNRGTAIRIKQYTGRDSIIIPAPVHVEEVPRGKGDYVLHHVREYPVPEADWPARAGEELGIPVEVSNHQYPREEYLDKVAGARFLVTPYTEASTGGLTILEGLYNGVPSLVADGELSGGMEYLGKFANTFKHDSYSDFKHEFKKMWKSPPKINLTEARQFVVGNYSFDTVARIMAQRFKRLAKSKDNRDAV